MGGLLRAFVHYDRDVRLGSLGARRRYVCVRRPGLRFYLLETRALVVESRVFAGTPHLWPTMGPGPTPVGHLSIPLEGSYVARRRRVERAHEAGTALADPGLIYDERWEGSRFRMLCVEWGLPHGRPVSALTDFTIDDRDLAQLSAFADALSDGSVDDTSIEDAVKVLRAMGVPLAPLDAATLTLAPPTAIETARALTRLHTRLDLHPDLSDLQATLGISSRQIRRRLAAQGEWGVTPIPEWRATLRRTRVLLAPSLATAPGATVEAIARALGYRSANALLFALDAEGVPTPTMARRLTLG